MPTKDSKKLIARKFDNKINARGVKSPVKDAEVAEEEEGPRIPPWLTYFLLFVLFGSAVFGAIQNMQSGPVF